MERALVLFALIMQARGEGDHEVVEGVFPPIAPINVRLRTAKKRPEAVHVERLRGVGVVY